MSNQSKLNRSAKIKTFPSCNSGKRSGKNDEEYREREIQRRRRKTLLKLLVNDCFHDKRGLTAAWCLYKGQGQSSCWLIWPRKITNKF